MYLIQKIREVTITWRTIITFLRGVRIFPIDEEHVRDIVIALGNVQGRENRR